MRALALALALASGTASAGGPAIWHGYADGAALAAETGLPILLWFSTAPCQACDAAFCDADVGEMLPDFVLVRAPGIMAEQFDADPGTIVMLDPAGEPLEDLQIPMNDAESDTAALIDLMSSGLDVLR